MGLSGFEQKMMSANPMSFDSSCTCIPSVKRLIGTPMKSICVILGDLSFK